MMRHFKIFGILLIIERVFCFFNYANTLIRYVEINMITIEVTLENTSNCVAQFVNKMHWKKTLAQISVSLETKIYSLDSVIIKYNSI